MALKHHVVHKASEFLDLSLELAVRTDNELWWRGHGDSEWHLRPGVYRGERGSSFERNAALNFKREAPIRRAGCPAKDDYAAWLQLMQHYRLPTRLLDWSMASLVALFFAVEEPLLRDAVVWALDPFGLNAIGGGAPEVYSPDEPKCAVLLRGAFSPPATSARLPAAMLGDEIDLRMMLQSAAFTVHSDGRPMQDIPELGGLLTRIMIPASKRAQIKESLRMMGVHRASLFPDLEGLARHLGEQEWV